MQNPMQNPNLTVQSRFAETLTLTPNPNFGESGFGESGRHRSDWYRYEEVRPLFDAADA